MIDDGDSSSRVVTTRQHNYLELDADAGEGESIFKIFDTDSYRTFCVSCLPLISQTAPSCSTRLRSALITSLLREVASFRSCELYYSAIVLPKGKMISFYFTNVTIPLLPLRHPPLLLPPPPLHRHCLQNPSHHAKDR